MFWGQSYQDFYWGPTWWSNIYEKDTSSQISDGDKLTFAMIFRNHRVARLIRIPVCRSPDKRCWRFLTIIIIMENPMDGGAWKAAVHGVAEGRTRLSNFTFTFHFHALEKEMATHSSVLAWRVPGTGKPGGLLSRGSHRVGHDWSDLAVSIIIQAPIRV